MGEKSQESAQGPDMRRVLINHVNYCTKIGINSGQFHMAFSIILKGKARDFYYDKIAGRGYDFNQITDMIRTHFETEENRQKYLSEWRETTLASIIMRNPEKNRLECLELLFDSLRTAQ
jgi:hypothetical protein